jgi:iron(III) transport system substrate-binding protein
MRFVRILGAVGAAIVSAGLPSAASAQGNLVLYCANQIEWCQAVVTAFEKKTAIKVAMSRKSSGEWYAQVKAEASNPKGDVWWAGTGDPHLQAAEEGLTEVYKSPMLAELQDWAVKQAEQSGYRTVGVYAGALGYGYNTEQLKKKGLSELNCWKDLLDPKLKGEVQVADPNASGTSYTMLATMVQLMGEDGGFDYLKALHKNINQYTKSGAAPAKATALGETTVGIVFQHDMVTEVVRGAPIKVVAPCEGTGYEIGSMSIIKGARNLENAKKWYDWVVSVEAQTILVGAGSFQVQSNKKAPTHERAPNLAQIKLIDYDFKKYGSSAERSRLLTKWGKEVKALPN